jgi:hypothetical protein
MKKVAGCFKATKINQNQMTPSFIKILSNYPPLFYLCFWSESKGIGHRNLCEEKKKPFVKKVKGNQNKEATLT